MGSVSKFACLFNNNFRKAIAVDDFAQISDAVKIKFSNAPGFCPDRMVIQYDDIDLGFVDLDDVEELYHRNSNILRISCYQENHTATATATDDLSFISETSSTIMDTSSTIMDTSSTIMDTSSTIMNTSSTVDEQP